MKKNRQLAIYAFMTIVCFILSTTNLKSQITIGSNETPAAGALLQLKDKPGIVGGAPNSDKGISMPRVKLEKTNKLAPCADETSGTNAIDHVGLVVYNTTSNEEFCPGMYVWDGQQWVSLFQNSSTDSYITGDTDANSFIIPPTKGIIIPVERAYKVWEGLLSYPSGYLSNNEDDITAELIWQDTPDLFNRLTLIRTGYGRNAMIKLDSGCAISNNKVGNAIVAVRIKKADGTENEIRWSWHIWVTDYDPSTSSNDFNSFTWMDRNLGATNITPGDMGSIGLFYQWGRKDPFPGSKSRESGQSVYPIKDIYDAYNSLTSINKVEVNVADNIEGAIKNPSTFYTQTQSSVSPKSWFTNGSTLRQYNLWGAKGTTEGSGVDYKSYYDPCPKGWRVPVIKEHWYSPWAGANATAQILETDVQWVGPANTAYGVTWGTKWNAYLPITGNWYPNGDFNQAATAGNIWSGNSNGSGFSKYLRFMKSTSSNAFDDSLKDPSNNTIKGFGNNFGQHPAHAYPVRCVKDNLTTGTTP